MWVKSIYLYITTSIHNYIEPFGSFTREGNNSWVGFKAKYMQSNTSKENCQDKITCSYVCSINTAIEQVH